MCNTATTCSNHERLVTTLRTECQQEHIYYAPPKQVRTELYRLSSNLTDTHVGAVTAIMTNPIWVVKVRMFTTRPEDPTAYRNLWREPSFFSGNICYVADCLLIPRADGFTSIYRTEGLRGLYRGTSLALFGVSNGAIQFMGYEEMKRWGFDQKRKRFAKEGREWTPEDDKLVRKILRSHALRHSHVC